MPLFEVPKLNGREQDLALLKKSKTRTKTTAATKSSGGSLVNKINAIKAMVETHLGKYKDETLIIQDIDTLHDYIDKCIANGICGIDTETTGLDPLQDDLVGVGIYTPNEKTTYIPINHISYVTGQRVKNQLTEEEVGKELARLNIDIDMFNAPFDIRFIKNHNGPRLKCTWDAYLASRCLNENEPNKGLKKLHQKYVLRGEEDAFKFDEVFKGVNFAYVPIQTGALYAAHDPKITYEYAEYQRNIFKTKESLKDVYWVFKNIEMPCIDAIVELEDNGVEFDFDYNQKLKDKYHKILDEKMEDFQTAYHMYDEDIANYDGKVRFDEPINIASVPQLQALLYDIIGLKGPIDKKTKEPSRSTSEEALKVNKDNAVVKAILEYREFATIVSTFIDKLPECVNPKDGRIHCKFNQYGADTGRMSSQDPNLQNIPSHNKEIRKMFKATDGYVMISSDYSQQEPRMMALLCDDEKMINAYKQGKDLYAEIASLSFNTTYENCLEFRPDGTTNPEGKERRSQAKSILLGVLYGRGVPSIAEQLGTTTAKAQAIKDSVFRGFPAIEQFEKDSIQMAEDVGYVTTLWGRKRRLPAMMLPDYEFEYIDKDSSDPLSFDEDEDTEVPQEIIDKYMRKLSRAWGAKRGSIIAEARQEGIKITDNTKNKDITKVVNARIQGSAADLTKLAMIRIVNDERLKELGFRLLIPVHDELIGECPEENVKEVAERFTHLMNIAGGERFTIPIKCDAEITKCWYGEPIRL